jgi:hypothetical protein
MIGASRPDVMEEGGGAGGPRRAGLLVSFFSFLSFFFSVFHPCLLSPVLASFLPGVLV